MRLQQNVKSSSPGSTSGALHFNVLLLDSPRTYHLCLLEKSTKSVDLCRRLGLSDHRPIIFSECPVTHLNLAYTEKNDLRCARRSLNRIGTVGVVAILDARPQSNSSRIRGQTDERSAPTAHGRGSGIIMLGFRPQGIQIIPSTRRSSAFGKDPGAYVCPI